MTQKGDCANIGAGSLTGRGRQSVISLCFSLFLALCGPVSLAADHNAASKPYTFGVTPQFEQRKLHTIWTPIIRELEQRTGLRFELVTTLNIKDFEKEVAAGNFDFVYTNPYHTGDCSLKQQRGEKCQKN